LDALTLIQLADIVNILVGLKTLNYLKGNPMALKKCRECGKEVSTQAKTCPSCGCGSPTRTGIGLGGSLLAIAGLFILIAVLSEIPSSPPPPSIVKNTSVAIQKSMYGENWPFTVSSGVLECRNYEVTFKAEGMTFAVNGQATAKGKYQELEKIWKDDPKFKGLKISVGDIIDKGLKLCDD